MLGTSLRGTLIKILFFPDMLSKLKVSVDCTTHDHTRPHVCRTTTTPAQTTTVRLVGDRGVVALVAGVIVGCILHSCFLATVVVVVVVVVVVLAVPN